MYLERAHPALLTTLVVLVIIYSPSPFKYLFSIILFSGLSHHIALSIEWLEAARVLAENTGGQLGETENILKHLTEKRIQHDQNWR